MKKKSKHEKESFLEETSHASSEEEQNRVDKVKIPRTIRSNNEKPESRSSSGIGTASHQSSRTRDGFYETSSGAVSPSLKDENCQETSDRVKLCNSKKIKVPGNTQVENKKATNVLTTTEGRKYQPVDNALESKNTGNLYPISMKKNNFVQKYELSKKKQILAKYNEGILEENGDEDFASLDGEHGMDSEYNSKDDEDILAAPFSRTNMLNGFRENIDEKLYSKIKPKDENKKMSIKGRKIETTRENRKIKKYKHVYENKSESNEETRQGKDVDRELVEQLEEMSDSTSREEDAPNKTAIHTLKKTFTNILSKIHLGNTPDTSSLSDNCSEMSKVANNGDPKKRKSIKKLGKFLKL